MSDYVNMDRPADEERIAFLDGAREYQEKRMTELEARVARLEDIIGRHTDKVAALEQRTVYYEARHDQHRRNHRDACPLCDDVVLDEDKPEPEPTPWEDLD